MKRTIFPVLLMIFLGYVTPALSGPSTLVEGLMKESTTTDLGKRKRHSEFIGTTSRGDSVWINPHTRGEKRPSKTYNVNIYNSPSRIETREGGSDEGGGLLRKKGGGLPKKWR